VVDTAGVVDTVLVVIPLVVVLTAEVVVDVVLLQPVMDITAIASKIDKNIGTDFFIILSFLNPKNNRIQLFSVNSLNRR